MKNQKTIAGFLIIIVIPIFLYSTYMLSKNRVDQASVQLPVQKVSSKVILPTAPVSELEEYRSRREVMRQEDIRTLQTLLESEAGNTAFLEDAAKQLNDIIASREAEIAIEGALLGGGFSPCLAVVAPGSVTVIVPRESLTRGEAALILTMCASHTDQAPENIRIMTNGGL